MYNNNKKIPHVEKESLFLKYLNIRKSKHNRFDICRYGRLLMVDNKNDVSDGPK